jgi:hypothetical protein
MDDAAEIERVANVLVYAREIRNDGDIILFELLAWTDSRKPAVVVESVLIHWIR